MDIFKNLMYMARRFKTATVLNLIGLTIAFAAFFLLMTQIDYSRSFNRALQDSERIYRLETFIRIATDTPEWIANTTRPVAEALDGLPEVECVAITMPNGVSKVERDGQQWRARRTYISHNAMSVLTGEPVNGTLTFSDEDHSGCLISASMAQKFFGRTDVAGEMIKVDGKDQLVKGVYQNFPDNCNIHDAIFVDLGDMDKDNFGNYNFHTYVKIQSGVDTKALMERFSSTTKTLIVDAMYGMLSEADIEEIGVKDKLAEMLEQRFGSLECRLVPITETYFSGVDKEDDRGNAGILFILELASVLVLVVAAINFLNFALAESPIRIKGVNTRRVLGEGLVSLCLKLVGETIVMSLVACAMSLVAVWLLAQWPLVGDMFQGSIALSSHGSLIILLVAVACVVGLLAGIYPARFMTSFEPALALKGSFGLTPGGRKLRTGLVCLQLFVSSLMAIYIGILYLQSQYIYTSDYGFDKAEVVYADMSVPLMSKTETLRSQLLQLTGVESVGFSSSALATSDIMTTWGRDDHDHTAKFSVMFVDHYYLQTMGIPIVEGRDFNEHDQGCYVINQAARQKWPWVEMDKKLLTNDYPVVGVCQNVRFTSTRMSSDAPLAFFVPDDEYRAWGSDAQILNVRIAPGVNHREMREKIHDAIMQVDATEDVQVRFVDEVIEGLYKEENRFIHQVMAFSLVCLIITLIGVFCLTMFETEYRRKEIGIRKVFGSSSREILALLSHRYIIVTFVAFLMAAPVAWYFGTEWLQNFAERTPIYWWLFPLALLLVGIATLATVAIQGWRAATENPINSIKTE